MSLINYLKDVKGEMKHVAWPTRKQVIVFTAIVILISLFTAYFLGVFDFILAEGLNLFIE